MAFLTGKYRAKARSSTVLGALIGGLAFAPLALAERPNIVLIVADDMGYTDLGVTGGEIDTPNLDQMAQQGLLISDFQVTPQCSPTRSMMLSGTDSHLAGMGQMAEWKKAPNQQGQPGYVGYLRDDVMPISETLKNVGYNTYMVGKWHLGLDEPHMPHNRGFEQSFVLLQGGASHFGTQKGYTPEKPIAPYRDNGKEVESLPKDFFSTDFYTDKVIEYIDADRNGDSKEDKPFFAYVAYTAPHWPLQAPDSWIDKYKGRYDQGFEALAQERSERAKALGLFPEDAAPYAFTPLKIHNAWDSLSDEQKAVSSRKMEIYAAMVANMDFNIGRLLQHLKEIGEYDNTLFVFMSDNGPEGGNPINIWKRYGEQVAADWKATYDLSLENLGRPNSFAAYQEWAQASAGPFRDFKGTVTEGGIRSPLIVKYPGGVMGKVNTTALTTVMDLAPTFLDVAGAEHPATYNGIKIYPHKGKSLMPMIRGEAEAVHYSDYAVGVEIDEKQALRKGDWKLVWVKKGPVKTDGWQLFNIASDPGETTNLADANPDKLAEMKQEWERYVAENGLVIAEWPEQN
ncbi:arylsulfatase [Marinobacterium mangrovicola]|uniref:Arylsulfatase n=1 Tax=Marinobacterium mangrovicola TaxID=1476959 RepID=A0A4R1GJI8_9GAMM|nr:arylsulfatase [Marinobacterium mangrovicola]TCK07411.1 arylsulfatase [Marinobacterium mangrovicola]